MSTKLPTNLNFKIPKKFLESFKDKESALSHSSTTTFSKKDKLRIVIEGQSNELSIGEICKRERITPATFYLWTKMVLDGDLTLADQEALSGNAEMSGDDKFRIVLDGLNGECSVSEICRKEGITHEQFLNWSREFVRIRNSNVESNPKEIESKNGNKKNIKDFWGIDVLKYIECFLNLSNPKSFVFSEKDMTQKLEKGSVDNFIFLPKINDIRFINKFFESVNEKMESGNLFIGCFETFSARRERLGVNSLPFLNQIYFGFEFIVKRVIPKLSFTKRIYFDLTKGSDRLLSKAEGLGRLVSCGFKIIDHKSINGLVFFIVKKEAEPTYDMSPSYGPLYAMPRLGKNGKIIKVYKFRTMHPYSEYLQDYIVKSNGYAETGKPANDFRVPDWGKLMRRFWLDETPQIINILKGDLKLVGIRPVSQRYFQDIPVEMQKLRLTQKPGCIPPYVALNRPGNVMSVLQSERQYLEEKIKYPFTTDLKYFFMALYSIFIKHKRSA